MAVSATSAPVAAPAAPTPAAAPAASTPAAVPAVSTPVAAPIPATAVPAPASARGDSAVDDLAALIAGADLLPADSHAATELAASTSGATASRRRDRSGAVPEGVHPAASARRSKRAPQRGAASGAGPAASTPGERTAPTRPAATRAPRRVGRRLAPVVAMGFAAALAVTTSVPAMSLMTPAEVQAMALESTNSTTIDGQRVEIADGVVAEGVDSEGYKTQTIEEYAEAAGIRPEATFTNNPAGTIQWPFAIGVHIGDRFGYRDCAGCSSDHHGQDFNPGYGAEIQSIADGVVVNSTDEGGSLGTVVMIDHQIDGQTVTSVYAHMISGSRLVEEGDTVEVGQVIGQTGNTGMSTGPHLHFEIRIGGMDGEWVDPLEWLYANTN
ncbi:peptidoglycan DD-metalloendopeptidase family protein [Agromyces sp. H3Y2-19a]|uniref:M23 family metallopeptidase n=1 Tax=Agromyces chromiiresistens TaxID=3030835 RepID=UPI0023BA092B|nr:peptidoglycan DD-metalloendopeptidase family protein [Agromyces chromiiresistens]MDF0513898.1 peptidoglycan DD-metalloendopeptidase family protein [Agromyces chromiiresistens]